MGAHIHGVPIFMGCLFCVGAYYPDFTVGVLRACPLKEVFIPCAQACYCPII